jgi:cytochrome P450
MYNSGGGWAHGGSRRTADLSETAAPAPARAVLGDVLSYDADAPSQSAIENAARLGPIFEVKAFGVRYVVAAGADVVTDLNDESLFCKHIGPEIEALRILGGDGLFTAYNDEPNWHRAHKLLMPAFTQSAMRRYHSTMLDVADELTSQWDLRAGTQTVDVSADTTRTTLETIGRCAAGYSFGVFETETMHPFVEHMVPDSRAPTVPGCCGPAGCRSSWPGARSARSSATPTTCMAWPTRSSRNVVRRAFAITTICWTSCWRRTWTRPISATN